MTTDAAAIGIAIVRHRLLGEQIGLQPGRDAPPLRLLWPEARALALAIEAVLDGRSAERELFLSPIACDRWLVIHVRDIDFELEIGDWRGRLDRSGMRMLADGLQALAPQRAPA